MNIGEIALRYSKALFRVASSDKQLEEHLEALTLFVQVLNESPHLMEFFSSPQLSREQKEKSFEKVLEGHFTPNFLSFLSLLLDRRRFYCLPEILREYRRMVSEKLGFFDARLITAVPMDDKTKEMLKTKLEKIYGKIIKMKEEIDPQIIGGGVLILDHTLIDFSIRGKIAKLKDDLMSVNV